MKTDNVIPIKIKILVYKRKKRKRIKLLIIFILILLGLILFISHMANSFKYGKDVESFSETKDKPNFVIIQENSVIERLKKASYTTIAFHGNTGSYCTLHYITLCYVMRNICLEMML